MNHYPAQHLHDVDPPSASKLHPNALGTAWVVPGLTERVKALWTDHTLTQICKIIQTEFGVTLNRSQVIGKLRRLGLGGGNKTALDKHARNLGQKSQNPRPKLRIVRAAGNSTKQPILHSVETDMPELRCIELPPLNLTLADLSADGCHYIAGNDHLYCGHKVQPGKPYCPAHCRLVYQAVRPSARVAKPHFSLVIRRNCVPAVWALMDHEEGAA